MEKDKLLLRQSTTKQFDDTVKKADKVLKEIQKDLNKIGLALSKLDGQERYFVTDVAVGSILTLSKLPTYLLGAITAKYSFLSQMPYIQAGQKAKVDPTKHSYLGQLFKIVKEEIKIKINKIRLAKKTNYLEVTFEHNKKNGSFKYDLLGDHPGIDYCDYEEAEGEDIYEVIHEWLDKYIVVEIKVKYKEIELEKGKWFTKQIQMWSVLDVVNQF